jgi:hypothetical protein
MIKKIHAISVYDYIDMLNEEIGFKWNEDNIWFPQLSKHLYNDKTNTKHIEKKS